MAAAARDVTRTLARVRAGDPQAASDLLPVVYGELRRLAGHYLNAERAGHTLQPTALVHEAYLRLVNQEESGPVDRAHFVALAARAMRLVLVDYARSRQAAKRGKGWQRVPLDDAFALFESRSIDLIALDEALCKLAEVDEQRSRIVELRFFGGLTNAEAAEVLGISVRTVEREWRLARARLYCELTSRDAQAPVERASDS